jgi:hypothetical protein
MTNSGPQATEWSSVRNVPAGTQINKPRLSGTVGEARRTA